MIVYHVCESTRVPGLLGAGLRRAEGRQFVFEQWVQAQRLLACLGAAASRAAAAQAAEDGVPGPAEPVVLVLDVDTDMLVPAPLPAREAGAADAAGLAVLQRHSAYLDMDLHPGRILDVKDGQGDSLRARFRGTARRRAPVLRFLAYMRPYWPLVALATAAGVLKFLCPLVYPYLLRLLLDDVVLDPAASAALKRSEALEMLLVVLGVNLVWMAATYVRSVWAAMAGQRMIRDLRVALFAHVQRLSHAFFTRNRSGAIVSRVVNDLTVAQNFVGSALTTVWMDGVLLAVLVAVLMSIHPGLTLVSMALMPIYVLSRRTVGSRIRLIAKEAQQRLEILSGGLQEKVAGVAVVKGFTREHQETQAFARESDKLLSKTLSSVRLTALNEMLVGLVVHSSPVLVVWYGVELIIDDQLTVGQLTQFLLYLGMFYFPLQRLSELTVVLGNSLAAIERIFEYFDTQPQVLERAGARSPEPVKGRLQFDRVCFSYDRGRPVLHEVSLDIAPGETLAFVGPSGSGKSTLANLVPRFYDPDAGALRLDGVDLRDFRLDALRRCIGIVNQETVLFSGTVLENLMLARPEATREQAEAALEAANASGFVNALPEGILTEIGERGAVLSGGQKQRIAIARAFLKDPRILILDEATSSLDSRSEQRIQQALARLLRARTAIVIAHRLSTVLDADRIAVVDEGRVVELGRHAELLARGGLYARLYAEQFRTPAAASWRPAARCQPGLDGGRADARPARPGAMPD